VIAVRQNKGCTLHGDVFENIKYKLLIAINASFLQLTIFKRHFAYAFREEIEINAKKPYNDRKQLSQAS